MVSKVVRNNAVGEISAYFSAVAIAIAIALAPQATSCALRAPQPGDFAIVSTVPWLPENRMLGPLGLSVDDVEAENAHQGVGR